MAQQLWLASPTGAILCDTGDGTLRDVLYHDLPRERLAGLLFTHGHFDHMGGLHSLLGFLRMIGRKDDLPIYYPDGCSEVEETINGFLASYGTTTPFVIRHCPSQPGVKINLAGMEITPYAVTHHGGIAGKGILGRLPAFGYRITSAGETIAVSGDTGDCPALRELVADADLAVIEATYARSADADPDMLKQVHLSAEIAAEIGKTAREYILIHRRDKK